MSKLTAAKLESFTAFADLHLKFSPGVNIVVGENGVGKTHLLKALYAACAITEGEDAEKTYAQKLRNVFAPFEGRIGRLARRETTSVRSKLTIKREKNLTLTAEFSNHTKTPESVRVIGESRWKKEPVSSAYIPVKEMLAHAPGFLATAAKREIAFEEVYTDIIKRAFLPKLAGPADPGRKRLLRAMQDAIEGKVINKGEYFFLKNKQGELEFTLLAEGMRKLALIWLLIQNGTLLNGSVLFWDEPEANLNPKIMGQIVEVILELQRLGVQVFLTTHNYVVLKEFDLRKEKNDNISYISLFRDEGGGVTANQCENYADISPNDISGVFDSLYDRELRRSFGDDAQ